MSEGGREGANERASEQDNERLTVAPPKLR